MGIFTQIGDQMYHGLQSAHSAAMAVMSHLYHGLPLLNDEEKQKRLDICQKCPILTNDNWCGDGKTKGCGCYLPAKAALPLESCPSGYWTVHESASGILPEIHQKMAEIAKTQQMQQMQQMQQTTAGSGCTPCEQKRRLFEEMQKKQAEQAMKSA